MYVKSESEKSEVKVIRFGSFIFPETYIYYRSCLYLKLYKRKCAQQLSYWFKSLVKLGGSEKKKKIKIKAVRTVFNFSYKTPGFLLVFALFEKKTTCWDFFFKVPSRARSVSKRRSWRH